jgi:two-component system, OmpR family, phosphate regulon sensor histidine kinase PhoR
MQISKKYPLFVSSVALFLLIIFFIICYKFLSDLKVVPYLEFILVLSVVIIVSLIYLFSYFYFRRVSKEISGLIALSEKIKEGDRSLVKIQGKDELSELGKSLNTLAEKISDEFIRLKKLEKVRSEFLGNVSHELKTPIFSIQGYIETLKDGAINEPDINFDFLERIEKHAERLNTLVTDLIEISKIESGELKLSYRFFEVQEFIQTIIDELHSLALSNKISLLYKSSDTNPLMVFADKEKIRQVMVNLIENAIKYNRSNGSVTIELKNESKHVNISVIDTGIGIAEEHHSRIFERFYRIDKNRSREIGGTGLGLAIVKHIIEAHKSRISVESKTGEGSCFSFSLPKQAI